MKCEEELSSGILIISAELVSGGSFLSEINFIYQKTGVDTKAKPQTWPVFPSVKKRFRKKLRGIKKNANFLSEINSTYQKTGMDTKAKPQIWRFFAFS